MRSFWILTAILAFVLGLAYALVIAPRAEADTTTFISAAREAGYTSPDDELLRNGYLVCATSQAGAEDDLIDRGIQAAQRWLGQPDNQATDQKFIDLAQTHLCPGAEQ